MRISLTTRKLPLGLLLGCSLLLGGLTPAFATDITTEQLTPMVTAHVREKIRNWNTENVQNSAESDEITVLQVPGAPFHFPDSKAVKITLSSSAWEHAWSDRGIVRIRLEDNDGHSRELGVPIVIRIRKPVWVVRQAISANMPLRASDFTQAIRDVSQSYAYTVGVEQGLGAYIARVNLSPGEMLDARKIAIPPDVRYNDDIRILLKNDNGMTLSLPGVALADGRIGQTIRVRQSLYRRQYYNARIIDKNQVLVEM